MGRHTCCNKQKVKRGLWSPEEDDKLIDYITIHGHGCWSSVPRLAGLQRCGKSCRLRWLNYLRPELKRESFSPQEAAIVINLQRVLGNRWSQIAKYLPGRTDNEVKNFWNSSIKKKLLSQSAAAAAAPSIIFNDLHHNYIPTTIIPANNLLSHVNHNIIGGSSTLSPSLNDSITIVNQCNQTPDQCFDYPYYNELNLTQFTPQNFLPSVPFNNTSYDDSPTLSSSLGGFQHLIINSEVAINNQLLNNLQFVTHEQNCSCQPPSIYAPDYDDDQEIMRMKHATTLMEGVLIPIMPKLGNNTSSFEREICNVPYSSPSHHHHDIISSSLLVSSSSCMPNPQFDYFNNCFDMDDNNHVMIPSSSSLPPPPPPPTSSLSTLTSNNSTLPCVGSSHVVLSPGAIAVNWYA